MNIDQTVDARSHDLVERNQVTRRFAGPSRARDDTREADLLTVHVDSEPLLGLDLGDDRGDLCIGWVERSAGKLALDGPTGAAVREHFRRHGDRLRSRGDLWQGFVVDRRAGSRPRRHAGEPTQKQQAQSRRPRYYV